MDLLDRLDANLYSGVALTISMILGIFYRIFETLIGMFNVLMRYF